MQQQLEAEQEAQRAWNRDVERMQAAEKKRMDDIYNRLCIDRKTDGGYQSPTELNKDLDAMKPGDAIELHGDLFTAYDGTILSATYYRGAHGNDSVPVVLLHSKGGSRSDFAPIIPGLLKEGMAVLVPDIRGHGKSHEFIVQEFGEPAFLEIPPAAIPANPFGNNANWLAVRWGDYERLSADVKAGTYQKPVTKINIKRIDSFENRDFASMIFDLQVWQNFLINENNQERLNIKKLNLVGTEMGAGLSTIWCSWDQNTTGLKYTKTMTVISPIVPRNSAEQSNGNYLPIEFLDNKPMRDSLSTMIIIGQNNERALEDAKFVKNKLLNVKEGTKNPPKDDAPLFQAKYPLILCNTEKQGRDLISAATVFDIHKGIPGFINDRLGKLEAAAAERKNDRTLVWAVIGNWNKKVTPPPEKPTPTPTVRPTSTSTKTQ